MRGLSCPRDTHDRAVQRAINQQFAAYAPPAVLAFTSLKAAAKLARKFPDITASNGNVVAPVPTAAERQSHAAQLAIKATQTS